MAYLLSIVRCKVHNTFFTCKYYYTLSAILFALFEYALDIIQYLQMTVFVRALILSIGETLYFSVEFVRVLFMLTSKLDLC